MSLSLKVTSMLNSRSRQYGKRSVTRVLAAIALAASLASVGLLHAFPPEPDPVTDGGAEGTTAFIGVNVIPMDRERVLPYQIVIVEGDRIVRIGPANEVEVPKGAVTIDGRGKYMIPGLGEMHAHVPPQGGREWMEQVLFLYLSNGITTARGMLGQPEHLGLREDVHSGRVLGPRLYTSGPSLNGNSIPSADSARRAVAHQKQAGYDFLKIHPGLTREQYDAMVEAASELGMLWAGHVPVDVGLARALEVHQATIDHLDQYTEALLEEGASADQSLFFGVNLAGHVDEAKIPEIARATADAGVWNVPTQSLIEHVLLPDDPEQMAERPEMKYMPPAMVQGWVRSKRSFLENDLYDPEMAVRFVEVRRQLIKALHDAGAGLLLGSDAPQIFQVPGFSIQAELRMMVDSGLTPFDALEMGTKNVAMFFDDLDEYGTIEEGKIADFVLLEGNPLADITSVERRAGVMVRGRWLPESEIQERLAEIAASYER
jgi:imidazolonepropionase-like amidohydrolase